MPTTFSAPLSRLPDIFTAKFCDNQHEGTWNERPEHKFKIKKVEITKTKLKNLLARI